MKHHLNPTCWIAIALVTIVTPATLSGLDLDPILIGEWSPHPPGEPTALAVRDGLAYVVSSHDSLGVPLGHFWVFDVTDRTQPELKGYCELAELVYHGGVHSLVVMGHHAYVTTGKGLQIVDVSDPINPVPVQLVRPVIDEYGHSNTRGAAVSGNFAYTCVAGDYFSAWNLYIVDVTDPGAPVAVGTCEITRDYGRVRRLAVAGQHAYVCTDSGLQIIDIAQPSFPRRVGNTRFDAWDVTISGDYAYVASDIGLRVLNVANPANPVQVAAFPTQTTAYTVAMEGNTACVGTSRGVRVLDLSNPAQPRELAIHPTQTRVADLFVEGDAVYLVNHPGGLHIVDLSTPGEVAAVGSYPLAWSVRDVVWSRDYAYVAAGWAGLWVIDVNRPDQPRRVADLQTTGSANRLFVEGDHVYLEQPDALAVVDVSDPLNPLQVGFLPTLGVYDRDIEVALDYAYLADPTKGLQIIHIADPTRPEIVATVPVDGWLSALAVSGDYLYLAAGNPARLITMQLSSPSQPQMMGSYPLSHTPLGVAVLGNSAFVLYGTTLDVFDLSNPATPVLVCSYPGLEYPWGGSRITVRNGRAFCGQNVVDVSNPMNPIRVSAIPGHSFAVAGDHVYVAARDKGFRTYHLGRPATPQRLGWVDVPGEVRLLLGCALAGGYAYVSSLEVGDIGRLHVIDKRNPTAPVYLRTFDTFDQGWIQTMIATDQHLYVPGPPPFGLRVYDLQDPTSPLMIGESAVTGDVYGVYGIQIANDHAYLLMQGRLDIIDISIPAHPITVGQRIDGDIDVIESDSRLAVESDRLYLTGRTALKVFDISNPPHPRSLGSYHYDWQPAPRGGLAVSGDYAYMDGAGAFQVIDVSNPGNPHRVGSASRPEGVFAPVDLMVSGHFAYGASLQGVLHVYDIRDPSSPRFIGSNWSPTGIRRLVVDDGTIIGVGEVGNPALIVYDLYRPPLRLDPPEFLGLDGWRLRLWGGAGQSLRLQRSPDLHTWEDWQTTIGADLPQEFVDDTAGSRPRQFYRAVSP